MTGCDRALWDADADSLIPRHPSPALLEYNITLLVGKRHLCVTFVVWESTHRLGNRCSEQCDKTKALSCWERCLFQICVFTSLSLLSFSSSSFFLLLLSPTSLSTRHSRYPPPSHSPPPLLLTATILLPLCPLSSSYMRLWGCVQKEKEPLLLTQQSGSPTEMVGDCV